MYVYGDTVQPKDRNKLFKGTRPLLPGQRRSLSGKTSKPDWPRSAGSLAVSSSASSWRRALDSGSVSGKEKAEAGGSSLSKNGNGATISLNMSYRGCCQCERVDSESFAHTVP